MKLTMVRQMGWVVGCVMLLAGARGAANDGVFTFAAMGCMPYEYVENVAEQTHRLTEEINRRRPAFTVHLGDINSGSEAPTDAKLQAVKAWFGRFDGPLIYTPGDNEWTDAHRPKSGSMDPLERLGHLRELFFAREESLGRQPRALVTQRRMPGYERLVENARWTEGGVHFATIHVVGSDNNMQPAIPGAVAEWTHRDAANIAWLREVFAAATEAGTPGVGLFMQAQPFAYTDGKSGFIPGFQEFLTALEQEVRDFGKPVLLVHADAHRYRYEQSVAIELTAERVPNLHRVESFGGRDIHAVEVLVAPHTPEVFFPGPLIVPGNPRPRL
jgi:hypothetical protein